MFNLTLTPCYSFVRVEVEQCSTSLGIAIEVDMLSELSGAQHYTRTDFLLSDVCVGVRSGWINPTQGAVLHTGINAYNQSSNIAETHRHYLGIYGDSGVLPSNSNNQLYNVVSLRCLAIE